MRLLKYFTICPRKQIMFSNDRLKLRRNIYSSISFFNGEWICHHSSNWNSFSVLFIERIRKFLYFELLYQISEIKFKESNVCFHSVTSTFNKRIYICIYLLLFFGNLCGQIWFSKISGVFRNDWSMFYTGDRNKRYIMFNFMIFFLF